MNANAASPIKATFDGDLSWDGGPSPLVSAVLCCEAPRGGWILLLVWGMGFRLDERNPRFVSASLVGMDGIRPSGHIWCSAGGAIVVSVGWGFAEPVIWAGCVAERCSLGASLAGGSRGYVCAESMVWAWCFAERGLMEAKSEDIRSDEWRGIVLP
jgi:hypothetical protein